MSTIKHLVLISFLASSPVLSQMDHESHASHGPTEAMAPNECKEETVWDYGTATCKPLPMADMDMSMWMVHGNAFLVQNFSEGSRGRNQFSVPNMLMAEAGSNFKSGHYLNINLMLTFEKWTFPSKGYPELLQVGEEDENHRPYVDAQHPHSSPIMGLTLSDTFRIGKDKDHLKLFFAPRGQATEGPIAFMHRMTGMMNPDAPLGHHIGQDVSHITSTVIGASLRLGKSTIEASGFHGTEPEPTEVDLPIGKINSYATRLVHQFSDDFYAMISGSYIEDPEPHDRDIKKVNRYSASIYYDKRLTSEWMFHNSFIYGQVHHYDHFPKLRSFNEEFYLHSKDLPHNFWGRIEVLERGGEQLQLAASEGIKWLQTFTLGYTFDLWKNDVFKVGVGTSFTKNFIPSEFETAYGKDPVAGKIFIQVMGMKMGKF